VGCLVSRFVRYGGWQCLYLQGQDRLTLKMKALPSFETSIYAAKLRNSPEDSRLQCRLVCLCDSADFEPENWNCRYLPYVYVLYRQRC